jgi:hypothetical protein
MNLDRSDKRPSEYLGMGYVGIYSDDRRNNGEIPELIVPEDVARQFVRIKPPLGFRQED